MAWVKRGSRTQREVVPYRACFTVAKRHASLGAAEAFLQGHELVEATWRGRARLELGGALHPVLRVQPRRYGDMHRIAQDLRRSAGVEAYRLYDVSHPVESRWMRQRGLFPFCRLEPGTLRSIDDRHRLTYEEPPLRQARLEAQPSGAHAFSSPVDRIHIGEHAIEARDEREALLELQDAIKDLDPDVYLTQHGHAWTIPYLLHRIRHAGLRGQVRLGRDPDPTKPAQQERSFWTYGQVQHREATWELSGRWHVDLSKRSLETADARDSLHGLVYISRFSGRGIQAVHTHSPGYALQQAQVDAAQAMGVCIPWRRHLSEGWLRLDQLAAGDRGGQIHVPPVGVHGNAWEFDKSSYYPSLAVLHNLSSETLNCSCCPDAPLVPGLNMHFCMRRRGHQVQVLEQIVRHRRDVKDILRSDDAQRWGWASSLRDELKSLGVVSFGYARHAHSTFGRSEVHQAIQAWGRQGMTDARNIFEDHGWHFLHGIVDSLFPQKDASHDEAHAIAELVTEHVGVPLEVEARFDWLVFLPAKTHGGIGAPTRYYGRKETGELKIRGIELRRHNTPAWLGRAQQAALDALAQARTPEAFLDRIPVAVEAARRHADALRDGDVPVEDLAFAVRVTRDPDDYHANTLTRAALRSLRRAGRDLQPGQMVQYVVQRADSQAPWLQRTKPLDLLDGLCVVDRDHYLGQLDRCLETLFAPFCEDGVARLEWGLGC